MPDYEAIDRKLLNALQADFPATVQPYKSLSEKLGISEEEVLDRILRLKDEGIIRRIGAIFDSKKMGYVSMLCAVKAEPGRLQELGQAVSALEGVTHNYIREHEYNLWFTLSAPSVQSAEEQLSHLESDFNLEILRLPATKVFKTRVMFQMEDVDR